MTSRFPVPSILGASKLRDLNYNRAIAALNALGGVQELSGAGAISLTTLTTKLTTTGANALTLADGTEGQLKNIVMVADGGDGTLTPTHFANGTTITFSSANNSILLQFLGTKWYVIANQGCAVA